MRKYTQLTDALFAKEGERFAPVVLPHTWNALDGQDGGSDFHRGTCAYQIPLPNPTAGKRQYIEFEAANHVATVWCNGVELGTHKGGFSTFRFDLTDVLKDSGNELTVAVCNAECDVYPQFADFTFFGGLYRPVWFVEVEQAHFDLMKDGTTGIFVTPRCSGLTRLDVFPVNCEGCTVEVSLLDAEGMVVGCNAAPAEPHTILHVDVADPHLWQGMADPYCYKAVVSLSKDGEILDHVTTTYGYRSFRVDADTGFHLNGKSLPLRGVCRHQDREDKGWAISNEDHAEDLAVIKDMGANSIRLAHYQHAQVFYDMCDQQGFVIWAEIPFISKFRPGKDAYDNTMSQMKELIAQNYNHPAICFWCIANEITIGGYCEEMYRNLSDLNALCKRLDPSRLTTIAQMPSAPKNSEHMYVTDLLSGNYYIGWYFGQMSENAATFDEFHQKNPDRCFGVSEYGVDNLLSWHSAQPENHDYTEEYAWTYHHHMLKVFADRPYIWSTYMWNMFDFAVDFRDEGGIKGRNCKGLVSFDRKTYKDSFYVYKAYWTSEPMVHICGRRFVDRAPDERDVTVFTNADTVTLLLNGQSLGEQAVVDHAAVFQNVPLVDGENTLTAVVNGAEDTIMLRGAAEHNEAYDLPSLAEAKKAGNWFISQDDDGSEDIVIVDGMYSIEDPLSILFANAECQRIIKGWIVTSEYLDSTKKLSASQRLNAWKDRYPTQRIRTMKTFKHIPQKEFAKLNRLLSKVPKE